MDKAFVNRLQILAAVRPVYFHRAALLALLFGALTLMTAETVQADATKGSKVVHAVSGSITGTQDVNFFCDADSSPPLSTTETGTLSAAAGQPAGTTYSWAISGPCAITAGGTTATVSFRSTGAGKATATVTYVVNGVSTTSPGFSISTHMPKIGSAVASGPPKDHIYYPNDPVQGAPYYGFDAQQIVYTVVDQDTKPMPNIPVEEVFRLLSYDAKANNSWPIPEMGHIMTSGTGTFTDYFSTSNYSLAGYPGDPTVLKRPDSEPIAYLKHWWYAGPSTANIAKGCQLEYYPQVEYFTNGVTGD